MVHNKRPTWSHWLVGLGCWVGITQWAWGVQPFVMKDIHIEGLQRVEPGTVLANLPFRVGDTYEDEKGSRAIRTLFGLGLFSDVKLEVKDQILVVIVEERPTIAEITFEGTKEFDAEVMKKALKDVGLAEGRAFDKALADKAEQELKRQYLNRSLYGAEVALTATPAERNRVKVKFKVNEGQKTRIRSIRLIGHQAFDEETLLSQFDLDSGNWMSWYTKSNQYTKAKLNADLEILKSYYLTRGFLDFDITATQVALTPDKTGLDITITLKEGRPYVVSQVRLEGNYLGHQEAFEKLVSVKVGQAYNVEEITRTTKAFVDYFGAMGHAFAQVEVEPKANKDNGQVTFVFRSEPQRRAYVRRINIEGNRNTRDEVIRREFRQFEASWYDADRIRLSRDRVDRLGLFNSVDVDTQPVPNAPDQVDLVVKVSERPTGSINAGIGYTQAEKISYIVGYKEDNFFGSGRSLSVDLNTGSYNRTLNVQSYNPYFTDNGISQSFDFYHKTQRPYYAQGGDYRMVTKGLGTRFGVPFTEIDKVFFGLSAEQIVIDQGNYLPTAYVDQGGYYYPASIGWARDERDSSLAPSKGYFTRLNTEIGIGGGNGRRYSKTTAQFQNFWPLTKKYTFAMNSEIGVGRGLGGGSFPVLRNFSGGGLGSVRGFEQGTLGGTSSIIGSSGTAHTGGTTSVLLNMELTAPFPGAGNDKSFRWFTFYDIGNVYADGAKIAPSDLRSSVGVGISWLSPVGPLKFAWSKPVRKQDSDKIQTFQFQIGTAF